MRVKPANPHLVLLSALLLPGSGQVWNHEPLRGLIFLFFLLLLGGLTLLGFLAGRQRALATVKGDARDLHSLPGYYGYMVALFTAAPAFLLMVLWLLIQPVIVERNVTTMILPEDIVDGSTRDLVMADVRRIAEGLDAATVARIERLLYIAEYKRRQAPPGVKIGRRNFGRDRRYPISNAFRTA